MIVGNSFKTCSLSVDLGKALQLHACTFNNKNRTIISQQHTGQYFHETYCQQILPHRNCFINIECWAGMACIVRCLFWEDLIEPYGLLD